MSLNTTTMRTVLVLPLLLACVGCPGAADKAPEEGEMAVAATASTAGDCAPGATCIETDQQGSPDPQGEYTAQCSGTYPDYVDVVPADYQGMRFVLAQDFPVQKPAPRSYPWQAIDPKSDPDGYIFAIRDYVYQGMLPADWVAQDNQVEPWYHVPWMAPGRHPREFVRGMTQERSLRGPELGVKPGVTVTNYAIGYYNEMGAWAIGRVWADPKAPDPALAAFEEGSAVVKVLFSAGQPDDFQDPAGYILAGAPEWQANIDPGGSDPIQTVRLLQMDVAVRDDRAGVTGWVFGTFAYDKDATCDGQPCTDPWLKMMPVGIQWGNDPTLDQATFDQGQRVTESLISGLIPSYAASHLGWLGRLVGPVDNPKSACMSCHGTAQTPVLAPMVPPSSCDDSEKLLWFRNLAGDEAFGLVPRNACGLAVVQPPAAALDYSLQQSVALANFVSTSPVYTNPCIPVSATLEMPASHLPETPEGFEPYVVERGATE